MPIQSKTHKHYWKNSKWWQDDDYVEFPVLTYKKHYSRTKTIERKIKSLLRRGKPFLLNTNILTGDDILYVSGFNEMVEPYRDASEECREVWQAKKEEGHYLHISNCLPFLNGLRPIWGEPPPQRKRRTSIKRGISSRRNA
tara:strand:+ start:193 stop:615 length:423 start_codon:yes stop_codon:yes gene_type:complete